MNLVNKYDAYSESAKWSLVSRTVTHNVLYQLIMPSTRNLRPRTYFMESFRFHGIVRVSLMQRYDTASLSAFPTTTWHIQSVENEQLLNSLKIQSAFPIRRKWLLQL